MRSAPDDSIVVIHRPQMMSDLLQLLRLGIRYARQAYIRARLRQRGIRIARSATILGRCHFHGDIEIGPGAVIGESFLDGRGGIVIGQNVHIGFATIITAQHAIDSPTYETTFAPVTIGDYAVLYMRSVVLPGTRIGRGAVIAAGAVVTHDVPDMAVVAGNPARIIRYRACIHAEASLRRMSGLAPRRLSAFGARIRSVWSKLWSKT